jgi:FkbM family methyltransferase
MGARFATFSKRVKQFPRLFDAARRVSRLLGYRSDVYQHLSAHFGRAGEVTFLQIGANDGITTDPIREFVVSSDRWKGVLVEPQPDMFAQCVGNYRYCNHGQLHFLQAAVSDTPGSLELWKIQDRHLPEFPLFATGMASAKREHLLNYFSSIPNIAEKIEAFRVPCLTVHEILDRFKLARLDLLHMDVEGHETTILRSLPAGAVWPKAILFERIHLSAAEWDSLTGFLSSNGYDIAPCEMDCFAVRR